MSRNQMIGTVLIGPAVGRRRSSAFGLAIRRISQATGHPTDAEGRRISYEFYPSSKPCVILSSRKQALPVGLPEARIDIGERVRRMSLGVRMISMAVGRRLSMAARRMSAVNEECEEKVEEKTSEENVAEFKRSRRMSAWH
ncbi:hypothetical protein BV898_11446 [Hypsibius exemplaris]|uniref:Uncharacterized protein n=1 Tax=Hypsibius exemplaris TaxID=2072580 RepID=A0A1W0WGL3_HYPEX|nr:hypothetical protein BV898_11446 [Hypsibius exemplaris]